MDWWQFSVISFAFHHLNNYSYFRFKEWFNILFVNGELKKRLFLLIILLKKRTFLLFFLLKKRLIVIKFNWRRIINMFFKHFFIAIQDLFQNLRSYFLKSRSWTQFISPGSKQIYKMSNTVSLWLHYSSACFISWTYSPTYAGDSVPYFSIIFIMADPTITPSAIWDIFFACSGPIPG